MRRSNQRRTRNAVHRYIDEAIDLISRGFYFDALVPLRRAAIALGRTP